MSSLLCMSDIGYIGAELTRAGAAATAATIGQVAAAAIAIDNAQQLISNYNEQRDISQREINIAKAQQAQLRDVFWPKEDQFLAEFSVPEPLESVEVLGVRYAGRLVAAIAGAFATKLHQARIALERYATSANEKIMQDLLLSRALMMANARVFGRNIGFAEYQARYDTNVNRRLQAVQLGRGLINDAMTLLKAAGQNAADAGHTISTRLDSALQSFNDAAGGRSVALSNQHAWMEAQQQYFDTHPNGDNPSRMPSPVSSMGTQDVTMRMRSPESFHTMTGDSSHMSSFDPSINTPFNSQAQAQMNDGDISGSTLASGGMLFVLPGMLQAGPFPVVGALDLALALPPLTAVG